MTTIKAIKLTKTEPADLEMMANAHKAKTYGEWCIKETSRIGGDARYVEEMRRGQPWCRVERMVVC